MIGRIHEQEQLSISLESGRPEFIVVYGRRRVGKTFLIREYFHDRFAFYATGVNGEKTKDQLKAFHICLQKKENDNKAVPRDWFEAFARLQGILESEQAVRDPVSGRKIVFLDELPWMDTAKSDFRPALDFFWNAWGSTQKDLALIVCGSATSWMIDHLLTDVGGFYHRVTREIHVQPFTLRECEALMAENQFVMPRRTIVESYMVFGGIPFYLNQMDKRMSLAQNIDELCFFERGILHHEYDRLFRSLFRNPSKHMKIIDSLGESTKGMTRAELAVNPDIGNGEGLTNALIELEQCGFIRKYRDFAKPKQAHLYQIIDPFTLFSLQYLRDQKISSWMSFVRTPAYYHWCGTAFETVCLNHVPQIKQALGVPGVSSEEYAWRSNRKKGGGQIDLLIDRQDQVINACEMKYTLEPFTIDEQYAEKMEARIALFREETRTDKAIHLTMVSAAGLAQTEYLGVVQNKIKMEELFA